MKNLIKLKVILLAFFIIFSSQSIAADRILPIPKPIVDQETKIITAKKKEIYPQKKPLIFQKKIDKTVTKSTILSRKDFNIAKAAFEAIDKKKWQTAIKLSKKAKNKINWKPKISFEKGLKSTIKFYNDKATL